MKLGLLVALVAALSALARAAHALVPSGYEGIVVHVVFDGTGSWSRLDTGPTPDYQASANVAWHAEYDVTVPDVTLGFPNGLIAVPAEAGTTVTGSGTRSSGFPGDCTGPITVHAHEPPNPQTPFIGVYGGLGPDPLTLYIDTFGGYDYALCDGQTGILGGAFDPAGGGVNYNVDIGIAKFPFDRDEWANQPPHERILPVMDDRTKIVGTESSTANWSGTITLTSRRVGAQPTGVSAADKEEAADQIRRVLFDILFECFDDPGDDVFSGGGANEATVDDVLGEVRVFLCTTDLRYLGSLLTVFDDPPDPSFDQIARVPRPVKPSLGLPACAAPTAGDRRVCKRLESAVTRYALRVQHAADVAAALAITADRIGGAVQAGDTKAAKRQKRAFIKLEKKLAGALRARTAGGNRIASVLDGAAVTGEVSEAQSPQAIAALLTRAEAEGIAQAKLEAIGAPALIPQAIDVLAVLREAR